MKVSKEEIAVVIALLLIILRVFLDLMENYNDGSW